LAAQSQNFTNIIPHQSATFRNIGTGQLPTPRAHAPCRERERNGFKPIAKTQSGTSPVMTPMLRHPAQRIAARAQGRWWDTGGSIFNKQPHVPGS
jgi:hypothetical protein